MMPSVSLLGFIKNDILVSMRSVYLCDLYYDDPSWPGHIGSSGALDNA